MDKKEPDSFDESIHSQEAAQLALRGALATIHKLQELTHSLRAQLSATSDQNTVLLEKIHALEAEEKKMRARLSEGVDPDVLGALKQQYESAYQLKLEDLRRERLRQETLSKKEYRDKEIRLMQEWMEKEVQLREDRSKTLMASMNQLDGRVLQDRIAQETEILEKRIKGQADELVRLADVLTEKGQALEKRERQYDEMRGKTRSLLNHLRGSRRDLARLAHERRNEQNTIQGKKKELSALVHLLKEGIAHQTQQRLELLDRHIRRVLEGEGPL